MNVYRLIFRSFCILVFVKVELGTNWIKSTNSINLLRAFYFNFQQSRRSAHVLSLPLYIVFYNFGPRGYRSFVQSRRKQGRKVGRKHENTVSLISNDLVYMSEANWILCHYFVAAVSFQSMRICLYTQKWFLSETHAMREILIFTEIYIFLLSIIKSKY